MTKPLKDNAMSALGRVVYGLWVISILAAAWATMPYLIAGNLSPPPWLATLARSLFYRNYVF